MQLLCGVLDLHLRFAQIRKAEAVRAPGGLRYDKVGHERFEHTTGPGGDEGECAVRIGVVTFPDVELLPGYRIGGPCPGTADRPLPLP